MKEAVRL